LHALHDTDDPDRMALVVVHRVAEDGLVLEQRFAQGLADDSGRRRGRFALGQVVDHGGIEGAARRELDAERPYRVIVGGKGVRGRVLTLLVRQRVEQGGVAASR
jgi:hypothetical protein